MTIKRNKRIDSSSTTQPFQIKKQAIKRAYTPKQIQFIDGWLKPSSATFGNAYQSAINAGFSKDYARVITAEYTGLEWIREAKRYITDFTPEHVIQSVQDIALTADRQSDRLRALDILARIQGMYVHTQQTELNITFTNSVPRPKL